MVKEPASLLLCIPNCEAPYGFDASMNFNGVCMAVYIDYGRMDGLSKKELGIVEKRKSGESVRVMLYSSKRGWSPLELNVPVEQYPIGVKLSGDQRYGLLVTETSESGVFLHLFQIDGGSMRQIFEGKRISVASIAFSPCSNWIVWTGLEGSVTRVNSTHSSLFACGCDSEYIKISADTLILSCGFLDPHTVWVTEQRGVTVQPSRLYSIAAATWTSLLSKAPITSMSATRTSSLTCYATESLTRFPQVVANAHSLALPVSLGAESVQASAWQHPSDPALVGVTYSLPPSSNRYIVYLHGGPAMAVGGVRKLGLDDFFLPLLASGFRILSFAYRGSAGLGDAWAQASIGSQGVVDLADVQSVVSVLGESVAAVVGGSYGGFLTLHAFACMQKIPCFVALYPYVSSRGCAAESGDFAWEAEYTGVGVLNAFPVPPACLNPDVIPKLYALKDFSRPLLLLHGDCDSVCPVSQSRTARNILLQRGFTNVELVVYRGEGHGLRDLGVRKDCASRVLQFIQRHQK